MPTAGKGLLSSPCRKVWWNMFMFLPAFGLSDSYTVSQKFINMSSSIAWKCYLILMACLYRSSSSFEHVIQHNTNCRGSVNSFIMELDSAEWRGQFFYVQKVFGTVWHDTPLFNFFALGLSGQRIKVYADYLQNKSFDVGIFFFSPFLVLNLKEIYADHTSLASM